VTLLFLFLWFWWVISVLLLAAKLLTYMEYAAHLSSRTPWNPLTKNHKRCVHKHPIFCTRLIKAARLYGKYYPPQLFFSLCAKPMALSAQKVCDLWVISVLLLAAKLLTYVEYAAHLSSHTPLNTLKQRIISLLIARILFFQENRLKILW
jgi:hypothetical protein